MTGRKSRTAKKRGSAASPAAPPTPDSGKVAGEPAPEVGVSEPVSEKPRERHWGPHLEQEKSRGKKKRKVTLSLLQSIDNEVETVMGGKTDGDLKKKRQRVASSNNLETDGYKDSDTLLQIPKVLNSEVSKRYAAPLDEMPPSQGDFSSEVLEDRKKVSWVEKKYNRKKQNSPKAEVMLSDHQVEAPTIGSTDMDSESKDLNSDDSNKKLLTLPELEYVAENLDADPGNKHFTATDVKSSSHEMKNAGPSPTKKYKRKGRSAKKDMSKDHASTDSSPSPIVTDMKSEKKHDSEMSLRNNLDLPVNRTAFGLTEGARFESSKSGKDCGIHTESDEMKKADSSGNCTAASKVNNKSSFSKSSPDGSSSPSCHISQNCTSLSGASPSEVADDFANGQNNNETSVREELMLSAKREYSLIATDSVLVKKSDVSSASNLCTHEGDTTKRNRPGKRRRKEKKSSDSKKDIDLSSSSITSLETSEMTLVGQGNVDSSNNCSMALNVESGVAKCTDDTTLNNEEATLFNMVNEEVSGQSLSCLDSPIEQVTGNLPTVPLQVADSFDKVTASHEPIRSSRKKKKHTLQGKGSSKTASEKKNECLAVGIQKELQARVAADGSVNAARSLPPSPIRGVINDPESSDLPNSLILPLDSLEKEDVSFSFQLIDNALVGKPPKDYSNKACHTDSPHRAALTCNGVEAIVYQKEESVASSQVDLVVDRGSSLVHIEDLTEITETVPPPQRTLHSSRKKLIVLDLNGLLADIFYDARQAYRAHKMVGGKSVFKRPFCDDFLAFCFHRFEIGIWSSRKRYNVDDVVDYLMGDMKSKLLFCWDLSKCTETGYKTIENVHKPLVLKELKKLWNKEEPDLPWEKGEYSPSNTLLIDDSPYKALCNPPHTAIFPHPFNHSDVNDSSLGPGGDMRVYLEGLAMTDNVQHYVQAHPFGQPAINNSDPSWNFYLRVMVKIEKSSLPT